MRIASLLASAALAVAALIPAGAYASTMVDVHANLGVLGHLDFSYDPTAALEPLSTLDGTGVYDVKNVTGSLLAGIPVDSSVSNPNSDGSATFWNGLFFYDNDYVSAWAFNKISGAGLVLHTTFAGVYGHLYSSTYQGADVYALDLYANGAHIGQTSRIMQNQTIWTETVHGAVPEPATWALMIAGFGGAGAMLRRRRATASA